MMLKWILMQLLKGFVCTCWCLRVRIPAICAFGAVQCHAGCRLCVKWDVPRTYYKRQSWTQNITVHMQMKRYLNVFLKSTVRSFFVVNRQKPRMYLRVVCLYSVGSVSVWYLPLTDADEYRLADVYSYNLNTILELHLGCLLPYAS